MKKKKLIATVLSASMLVGLLAGCGSSTDPAESPTGGGESTPAQGETTPAQNDVDYANFVIDPAQIPQEKLDTTPVPGRLCPRSGEPVHRHDQRGHEALCRISGFHRSEV